MFVEEEKEVEVEAEAEQPRRKIREAASVRWVQWRARRKTPQEIRVSQLLASNVVIRQQ